MTIQTYFFHDNQIYRLKFGGTKMECEMKIIYRMIMPEPPHTKYIHTVAH